MNFIKATIATAAVITCCLGNEMPAKANTQTAAQTNRTVELLKLSLESMKKGNWSIACTQYKAYAKYKQQTGGFNYITKRGSSAVNNVTKRINDMTEDANKKLNDIGSSTCTKGGQVWANYSMPTRPSSTRLVSHGTSFNDAVTRTIRAHCDKEWGTNYRMVKYCVDQQTKAYNALR